MHNRLLENFLQRDLLRGTNFIPLCLALLGLERGLVIELNMNFHMRSWIYLLETTHLSLSNISH